MKEENKLRLFAGILLLLTAGILIIVMNQEAELYNCINSCNSSIKEECIRWCSR